jgi:aryl-alcohol dehydrogenase-like predicted oxidoreductase
VEIILGTAQLTQVYGVMARPRSEREQGPSLLEVADEVGIRTLDTAPAYGDAESIIGRHGASFAVHTKLPGDAHPWQELAASLARLARSSVEVVYLHDPSVVLDPLDPRLEAATDLVGVGAQALGASIYTCEQFAAAVADPRISVIQLPSSVLDRRISDASLQEAAGLGNRLIARSALLQGLLGDPEAALGRVVPLDSALAAFGSACMTLGRSPVEVALKWVLARPGLSGLVLGAETPTQLRALVKAVGAAPLTASEFHLLASLPLPADEDVDPRGWTVRSDPQREHR